MNDNFFDILQKIVSLDSHLTRITFAFAATAIIFRLTTSIKLFNIDIVSNSIQLLNFLGSEKLIGIISILLLYYLLSFKPKKKNRVH